MLSTRESDPNLGIAQRGGYLSGGAGSMLLTVALKLAVLRRPFRTPSSIHCPDTFGANWMPRSP